MSLPRPLPALRRPGAAPAAYAFAILLSAAAVALRWWLEPVLPPGFPYLTFFPAVVLTAFLAGTGPAILSAALCGAIAWWAFLAPAFSWGLEPGTALALSFYVAIVGLDIALIHAAFAAQARARAAEAEARALAESRSLLFSELQHRVSNNLQLVSTLLGLQGSQVKDDKALAALREAAERLALVGRIQRRLHDPGAGPVPLSDFLRDLAQDTLSASGAEGVGLRVEANHLVLEPDKAIPLALIVTELVSNALEHGFRQGGAGRVEVRARERDGGQIEVSVADDGVGLPPQVPSDSLGLRIADALARQLGGAFALAREGGWTVGRVAFRP